MNIFYLSDSPVEAARYHVDRHVGKMVLESAQLLCTAHRVLGSQEPVLYKATHVNHPCAIWTRESATNYLWLRDLMHELNAEYRYRYDKAVDHLSMQKLRVVLDKPPLGLMDRGLTPPRQAMPDEYRRLDPVEAYRAYYNGAKRGMHKWTNREVPYWITPE